MRISDPRAIRALAHPLRLDLLELVGRIGPATAAQCGRALGVSQASCSFHLRQLATYGFVEDAGPGRDRRERRWRIAELRLRIAELEPVQARQLSRVVAERELAQVLDWIERAPDEPDEWRTAGSLTSATVPLTTEDLAVLKQRWREALAPFVDAFEAADRKLLPGQRYVRFFSAASPLPDADPRDDDDDTDA